MNVLILTPDRVGSTLLQRLITIYMQFHEYDRPVINLHELTNGLIKYYSSVFNDEVLGKGQGDQWGYYQSLPEIRDLLKSVKHYKTSRLALYHLINRQDSLEHQLEFYRYLNENFFIISARRENLLDHVLSWGINVHSKKLNVYSTEEKYTTFADIYKNKIVLDKENIFKYLDRYKKYLSWCDDHFDIGSYFYYEKHLPKIEEYILQLPIFNNQTQRISWKDKFNIEFDDWNRCSYLTSDISGLSKQLTNQTTPLLTDGRNAKFEIALTDQKPMSNLSEVDFGYLSKHASKFFKTRKVINELIDHKILVTPVPIKLQTMIEKKLIIKNFDQCVEWYNEWVTLNNLGKIYTTEQVNESSLNELKQWHAPLLLT
jgi:hypothetical protein